MLGGDGELTFAPPSISPMSAQSPNVVGGDGPRRAAPVLRHIFMRCGDARRLRLLLLLWLLLAAVGAGGGAGGGAGTVPMYTSAGDVAASVLRCTAT